MNEEIKKAKESLEKLIEDISIDSGYSYPALYADIRTALNDFDRYHESQQDLIKGKDEYIAKLCCDRAEKSSALRIQENNNIRLVESNLRLLEENKELKEFVKIIGPDFYTEYRGQVLIINGNSFPVNQEQIDFLMKVAKKYAKKED